MTEHTMTIWNRAFSLPVDYERYPGETVLDSQREAFAQLEAHPEELEAALESLKQYVRKTREDGRPEENIENIFRYVIPKSIFLPHTKTPTAAILCRYKFDIEHGLAVLFEHGKFQKICPQDAVL